MYYPKRSYIEASGYSYARSVEPEYCWSCSWSENRGERREVGRGGGNYPQLAGLLKSDLFAGPKSLESAL